MGFSSGPIQTGVLQVIFRHIVIGFMLVMFKSLSTTASIGGTKTNFIYLPMIVFQGGLLHRTTDFDTMAGADRFGNIYFVRLPQDVSDEIEEDPTGGRIKWEQGKLNGAPNKVEEIVQFHVGDVVTCLQKASLIPGGGECIVFGTVMGSVGALHAFTSRDDVDFFSHLEMHMRQDHPPLCGRDHMAYRSSYFPVKDVIDGDLCEQFPTLPMDLQRKIADELDRTPGEILKKLEEVRNKII